MYIVVIEALIEHPVTDKPHRLVATYPVAKWNENTRIVANPGYVITAVLLTDDESARQYQPGTTGSFPVYRGDALKQGERRWQQQG